MRRSSLAIMLVLPAVAGCLGDPAAPQAFFEPRTLVAVVPSDAVPENRTADSFYFVLVSGTETAKQVRGDTGRAVACDRPWLFDYDRGAGVLRYNAEHLHIDAKTTQVVVAIRYSADPLLGHGHCGVSALKAFPGRARIEEQVRSDVKAELVVEAQNGFLSYNKAYFVPMGKKIHVNIQRVADFPDAAFHVTGDFEVANVGLFPLSGLQPVASR